VAVQSFLFKQPISVGDIVSFYAEVVKVGRTSITVDVQVFAERHPANPVVVKVTEAQFTYVAINEDGSKREVPPAPRGFSRPGRVRPEGKPINFYRPS
jgi:acyl-CoA thioesterase YciA